MGDKKPFRTTRPLAELRQGRDDWYKIRNATGSGPTQLLIYDEISWWGISAQMLVDQLAAITGDIEVHLNSPGGDVFDGIAIMNALKQHNGEITVMVDGLAASVASVIAMAAAPGQLIMCPGSMMMIHDAWGMSIGNAADMRQMADLLDKASGNIADLYAARSGKPADGWRTAMAGESWFKAQEAVDAGLADRLQAADDPEPAIPAADNSWDLSVFRNAPAAGERVLGAESMPVLQGKAIAVHHTATVDEPWDGPAAVAAMPAAEPTLAYCHAWEDSGGDPDTKATYKFPHHKTKGGPANLAGCRNGLDRLESADIPDGDRAGVRAHLQAHLDDADDDTTSNQAGDLPAWLRQETAPAGSNHTDDLPAWLREDAKEADR